MSSGSSTRENSPCRYKRYLQDTSGALGQDCDKELHIEQWLQQLRRPNISPEDLTKDLTEANNDKLDNDMCAAGDPESSADSTFKSSEVESRQPALMYPIQERVQTDSLADTESIPDHGAGARDSIADIKTRQR